MPEPVLWSARTHDLGCPAPLIDASPGTPVCINQAWTPYIAGALEPLSLPDYWPESQRFYAAQQIARLIEQLTGDPIDCPGLPDPNFMTIRADAGCTLHRDTIARGSGFSVGVYLTTFVELNAWSSTLVAYSADPYLDRVGGPIQYMHVNAGITGVHWDAFVWDCDENIVLHVDSQEADICNPLPVVDLRPYGDRLAQIVVNSLDGPVAVKLWWTNPWTCLWV